MTVLHSTPDPDSTQDRADQLLASRLALPEEEVRAGIDALIREHPDLATALRQRLRLLRELGLLSADVSSLPLVPERLGEFHLIRQLGSGGMGVVWEAEQSSLQRRVALKTLAMGDKLDPRRLAMFRREALAAGRLNHEGIVSVYEVGNTDGVHFIVTELIENGHTLADFIQERRKQFEAPPDFYRDIAELFVQLTGAMQAAHDAGVLHRDLKPSNILLDPAGRPKVADFGLAKIMGGEDISHTGDVSGTFFYMSPEQATGRIELDARSDVFSLGSTLYEALTLVRAFEGDTQGQVYSKLLFEDPADPRKIRSQVPADLALICLKALEKRRDDRYRDMTEFGEDLSRFLRNEPILAQKPTVLARSYKWARRHPTISLASMVSLLALIPILSLLFEKLSLDHEIYERAQRWGRLSHYLHAFAGVFDPNVPRSGHADTRQTLDFVRSLVEEEQDPQIELAFLVPVSKGYLSLGRYQECADIGLEYWNQARGFHGVQQIRIGFYAAVAFRRLGQKQIAHDLIVRVLETSLRERSGNSKLQSNMQNLRVTLTGELGQPLRAIEEQRQLVGFAREHHGESHRMTLSYEHNLADALEGIGDYPEAEICLRRNLNKKLCVPPEARIDVCNGFHLMGKILMGLGDYTEAEIQLRKAISLLQELFPVDPRDPEVLNAELRLAQVWNEQGRYAEAENLLTDILNQYAARDMESSAAALETQRELLRAASRQRSAPSHVEELTALLSEQTNRADSDHTSRLETMIALAECLRREGRAEEALVYLESFFDELPSFVERGHRLQLDARWIHAECWIDLDKPDSALPEIELLEEMLPPQHEKRAQLRNLRARVESYASMNQAE